MFWSFETRSASLAVVLFAALCSTGSAQQGKQAPQAAAPAGPVPRAADGKPDLQGIWQAKTTAADDLQDHAAGAGYAAGKSVVEGGKIPYLAAAAAKKLQNSTNRKTADPLGKCFMPGTPRIMYMPYPFQIFQGAEHVAIAFEWSQVHRLIYTNGKPALHDGYDSWMGSARGHWDGDTLVVDVKDHNNKTWFDKAGDFHSDALLVTERYTMLDADTIQYEATITDPKTFSKPWKITVPLVRQKSIARLMEYQCQDLVEEKNGAFERDSRTWYPNPGAPPSPVTPTANMPAPGDLPALKAGANLLRYADGKPNITGYFQSNPGGANYGLEKHGRDELTPGTQGVVIDPPDKMLPYQPWARAERINRELPERGYDDPTAHCFVAGVPRSMYTPSPYQIIQAPGYILILFERMSWRIIPLDGRAHLADNVRLWQGDSVGHWDGDILTIDTTNLNGKSWLNEVGDVLSYSAHIVETLTPVSPTRVMYRATVTDPIAYTKPYTIEFPLDKQNEELLEVACHEDNGDLQHLKDVRDEFRAKQKAAAQPAKQGSTKQGSAKQGSAK